MALSGEAVHLFCDHVCISQPTHLPPNGILNFSMEMSLALDWLTAHVWIFFLNTLLYSVGLLVSPCHAVLVNIALGES